MSNTSSNDERVVLSFFSGGMGLDIGLEKAGLPAAMCLEIDRWCCETIRINRPHVDVLEQDIALFDWDAYKGKKAIPEVFLIVGGPPCQSFSPGGNRAALSDPRGNLLYEYLRVVGKVRPKYFVLENVANITTAALRHRPIKDRPGRHWSLKKYAKTNKDLNGNLALQEDELSGSAIREVIKAVSQLGYSYTFGVLEAGDYGSPQRRFRFVLIGSRDHPAPALPRPTHGPLGKIPYVTVRDAIADLVHEPGPHSSYTPDVARFFDLVPPGGNWRSLPKELHPAALGNSFASGGGKTGFFRRLDWDAPSPTVTGKANRKGTSMCHPSQTRPVSVHECARLQGFPDGWEFTGAMNRQYLQIGNAVPVALGEAIGHALLVHRQPLTYEPEVMLEMAVRRLRASAMNKKAAAGRTDDLFEMIA